MRNGSLTKTPVVSCSAMSRAPTLEWHASTPERLWGSGSLTGFRATTAAPSPSFGALTLNGLSAVMMVEGGTDTSVFEVHIDHVLNPEFNRGEVVALDNLAAHKGKRARQRIEAAAREVVFQPLYSPDMNPIEHAWSKLKAFLRTARARCRDSLDTVIALALDCITYDDEYRWFRHCGAATEP